MSRSTALARAAIRRYEPTPGAARRSARRVYGRLPTRARAAVQRVRAGKPPVARQPLAVSVILPIFGTVEHLAECLRSLVDQAYTRLEIIVIDCGASAGALRIAEAAARSDRRIRLVKQPGVRYPGVRYSSVRYSSVRYSSVKNSSVKQPSVKQPGASLGAARDLGIQRATGDAVTFVDPNDVVPPMAYYLLAHELAESGSDWAAGAYRHFSGAKYTTPDVVVQAYAAARRCVKPGNTAGAEQGVNPAESLAGLITVSAENALLRMDFVRRIGLHFPGGTSARVASVDGASAADHEALPRALLQASSYDVVSGVVYHRRARPAVGPGRTPPHLMKELRDRIAATEVVYAYLQRTADDATRRNWLLQVLSADVEPYVTAPTFGDPEHSRLVEGLIGQVRLALTGDVLRSLAVRPRIALHTLLHGTADDFAEVTLANRELGNHLPTDIDAGRGGGGSRGSDISACGRVFLRSPYSPGVTRQLPSGLLQLMSSELTGDHALTRLYCSEGKLYVEGWAFVRHIDIASGPPPTIRVYLRCGGGQDANSQNGRAAGDVDLVVSPHRELVSRWVKSKWPNYDAGAFRATIGLDQLDTLGDRPYQLRITVETAGIVRDFPAKQAMSGGSAQRALSGGSAQRAVSGLSTPRLTPVLTANGQALQWSMSRSQGVQLRIYPVSAGRRKAPSFEKASKHRTPMQYRNMWQGRANRTSRPPLITVDTARVIGPNLVLSGSLTGHVEGGVQVVVRSDARLLPANIVIPDERQFAVEIPLTVEDFGYTRCAPYEQYSIEARGGQPHGARENAGQEAGGQTQAGQTQAGQTQAGQTQAGQTQNEHGRVPVRGGAELVQQLPIEQVGEQHRVRITGTKNDELRIRLSNPLDDRTVGTWNQAQLQRQYSIAPVAPLANAVFFQAYVGDHATDSAVAIHRELHRRFPEMPLYWGVSDWSVPLPEGAIPVLAHSREWFDVISRAEYLVNNVFFPAWFIKRPHQTYLETWHGVPLKRIGHSYWVGKGHNPAWIGRLHRQSASWDYLLSSSDFCTETLRDEFRYSGKVLQTGYPRNDVLAADSGVAQLGVPQHGAARTEVAQQGVLRQRLAERLGIDPRKTIVLYAPTWRDTLSQHDWQARMVDFLDLPKLARDLGDDYLVAVRGHGHNARAGSTARGGTRIVDLTYYPEISDLYLLADVVVTDYSSLMFDFAVTRKPMAFFAPDLDEYADTARGIYLDYEATVPGPLSRTQAHLTTDIRIIGSSTWQPDSKYLRFVQRFCATEDGRATGRVVDAIWGSGAGMSGGK